MREDLIFVFRMHLLRECMCFAYVMIINPLHFCSFSSISDDKEPKENERTRELNLE